MGLADRVDEPNPAHHLAGCAVGLLVASFDDAERDAFVRLRAGRSDAQMADLVADEGYRSPRTGRTIGINTYSRHRRGICKCAEAGLDA